MTVRLARPGDLAALCAIEQAAFVEADQLTVDQMRFLLAHPSCRCIAACNAQGRPVGYAAVILTPGCARLYSIAVSSAARGRNIGEALLVQAERDASMHGANSMILEARATAAPLLAFYDSFGYRAYGTRPRYYENAIDGLRMRKPLILR